MREFKSKEDFIVEISERLYLEENMSLYLSILDNYLKKNKEAPSMLKHVEKNFGSLIIKFPDLQAAYKFIQREKLKDNKRANRKKR